MKVLFMGTPDIAAVALKKLIDDGFEIVGAVSQPDKPKGRGHKLMPTPVKETAQSCGIAVYQPEKLKNGEMLPILEELKPDVIAVVAYGKILPEYVLNYPKYGCVNMHASLLPKYRGAAPVQWAVINGEKTTGVTTMLMDKGLDTGDILVSKELEIGLYETAEKLFVRIAELGADTLSYTLKNIENITPTPQNDAEHTYAPMLAKEMGNIDWTERAEKISKLICGMNSWPLAYTYYKGQVMKVISAVLGKEEKLGKPGEILSCGRDKGIRVQCGDATLYITHIQFAGGKKLAVSEYIKGHSIDVGEILTKGL